MAKHPSLQEYEDILSAMDELLRRSHSLCDTARVDLLNEARRKVEGEIADLQEHLPEFNPGGF